MSIIWHNYILGIKKHMPPEEHLKGHIPSLPVPGQWGAHVRFTINQSDVLSWYFDPWACGGRWLESVYYKRNDHVTSCYSCCLILLIFPIQFSNPPNNPVCLSYPSIKFCFCLKETTSFYSLLPSPQIVQKPWRELLTWKSSGILAVLSNFTRFYCNLLTAGAHWHHPNFLQIYIMIST